MKIRSLVFLTVWFGMLGASFASIADISDNVKRSLKSDAVAVYDDCGVCGNTPVRRPL